MSVKIGTNLEYQGHNFLDFRAKVETKAELKTYNLLVPEGFEVFCEEDSIWYIYDSSVEDPEIGHFTRRFDYELKGTETEEVIENLKSDVEKIKGDLYDSYDVTVTPTLFINTKGASVSSNLSWILRDKICGEVIRDLSVISKIEIGYVNSRTGKFTAKYTLEGEAAKVSGYTIPDAITQMDIMHIQFYFNNHETYDFRAQIIWNFFYEFYYGLLPASELSNISGNLITEYGTPSLIDYTTNSTVKFRYYNIEGRVPFIGVPPGYAIDKVCIDESYNISDFKSVGYLKVTNRYGEINEYYTIIYLKSTQADKLSITLKNL